MNARLFIVAIFNSLIVNGQNLVPNSSFEDVNVCSEFNSRCSPSAWFDVKQKDAFGYSGDRISSATGNRHLRIIVSNRQNNLRSYWETMLLHKLDSGRKYKIDLSIASIGGDPNLNDIGFCFADSMIYSWNDTILQRPNCIGFPDAKVKKPVNGWFRLEKEITAETSSQILIIGNFSSIDYQKIAQQRFTDSFSLTILIDDISITPAEKITCDECQETKDSLYAIKERHSALVPLIADTVMEPILQPTETRTDTLQINDDIYFASNSFTVSNPDSLEQFRALFSQSDIYKIMVIGFTDNTGTIHFNKELSLKRAQSISVLISAKFGINPSIIEVEGQGISQKYSDNKQNRRVEIYIFRK